MSSGHDVLECLTRDTPLGRALLVRIHRADKAPMGWRELWDVFAAHYPGRWAVQVFPDRDHLLDQAHKYHLWVLEQRPTSIDLFG